MDRVPFIVFTFSERNQAVDNIHDLVSVFSVASRVPAAAAAAAAAVAASSSTSASDNSAAEC